jgi:hypothetical protein
MFSANDSMPPAQSVKQTFRLLQGSEEVSDAGLLFRDTMLKLIRSDNLELQKNSLGPLSTPNAKLQI